MSHHGALPVQGSGEGHGVLEGLDAPQSARPPSESRCTLLSVPLSGERQQISTADSAASAEPDLPQTPDKKPGV